MDLHGLESEIRRVCSNLESISNSSPEMSGMDFARDHGWISEDEWQSAEDQSRRATAMQENAVRDLEALRQQYPQLMEEFLASHMARLQNARNRLQELTGAVPIEEQPFPMRFNLLLLPDLIADLQAWRENREGKRWPAWSWRIAFSLVEECEDYLGRTGKK